MPKKLKLPLETHKIIGSELKLANAKISVFASTIATCCPVSSKQYKLAKFIENKMKELYQHKARIRGIRSICGELF